MQDATPTTTALVPFNWDSIPDVTDLLEDDPQE
jgi:hypothetical protein